MEFRQTPVMEKIFADGSKYKCVVAGRRFGKTYLAIAWLLGGVLKPNQRRWIVMPTYRMGKMVAFPILKAMLRQYPNIAKINESNLSVTIGSTEIAIKGTEDPNKLRGSHLDKVVLDEYAFMKPGVWEEIIYPMMTTNPDSKALFIGTPDGFSNGFYDIFTKGQDPDEKDWKSWQFTTLEGGWVPPEEIERAKRTMDETTFKAEFLASFESAQNRCAYNFDRRTHVKVHKGDTPNMWCGMDFNVSKGASVIATTFTDSTVHYMDEICLRNSNTEEMAKQLREKYPKLKYVYPDPAGVARSTTSSKSDHAILRDYGFVVKARKKHPSHRDRLASLNRKLKDSEGNITMTVDPKCKELIKDLEQCIRDPKTGGIDKADIERTHFLDACSYGLEMQWSVTLNRAYSVQW